MNKFYYSLLTHYKLTTKILQTSTNLYSSTRVWLRNPEFADGGLSRFFFFTLISSKAQLRTSGPTRTHFDKCGTYHGLAWFPRDRRAVSTCYTYFQVIRLPVSHRLRGTRKMILYLVLPDPHLSGHCWYR